MSHVWPDQIVTQGAGRIALKRNKDLASTRTPLSLVRDEGSQVQIPPLRPILSRFLDCFRERYRDRNGNCGGRVEEIVLAGQIEESPAIAKVASRRIGLSRNFRRALSCQCSDVSKPPKSLAKSVSEKYGTTTQRSRCPLEDRCRPKNEN